MVRIALLACLLGAWDTSRLLPIPIARWSAEGNIRDALDRHHGATKGSVTFEPGQVGRAFSMKGDASYIQIPDHPNFRLEHQLTIRAWIKLERYGEPGRGIPLLHKDPQKSGDRAYALTVRPDGFADILVSRTGTDATCSLRISDITLELGQWHHVAGVYRGGKNPSLDVYMNGVLHNGKLVLNEGALPEKIHTNRHPVFLGAYANGVHPFSQSLAGLLDEVEIYDRALSAAEIQSLYHAEKIRRQTSSGN